MEKQSNRGGFEMRHYKDEDDEGFIDNLKDEEEDEDEDDEGFIDNLKDEEELECQCEVGK